MSWTRGHLDRITAHCILGYFSWQRLVQFLENDSLVSGVGGGGIPYKKDGSARLSFEGLKKRAFVPLGVFKLKTTTAGALAVSLKVLNRKNITGDNVLF